MARSSGEKRKGFRRILPVLAIAVAVLLLMTRGLESVEPEDPAPWSDGRLLIETQFGLCHEGGGTNCVVDGDTAWIGGEKVRIAGIDAPETREPRCAEEARLGRKATLRLRDLLSSGPVAATSARRDRDPHDRLLRNLSVSGKDVGETLVGEDLARRYRGRKHDWCG